MSMRGAHVERRGTRGGYCGLKTLLLIALGAVVLMLIGLAGCTATIVPPAQVSEPRTVYLLDHGRTSSLVLPTDDGMIRYAYGEYRWYALEHTGALRASGAMLWPTQATLGRNVIDATTGPATIHRHVRVGIDTIHSVEVEAEHVRELLDRLADEFDAGAAADRVVFTPARDLAFVPTTPRYHLFHNSNHASAHWLEALGCEVRGPTVLSTWRVRAAAP